MKIWKLQDAKARFSEVVREARAGTPQHITVRGEDAVVVVSADEYRADNKPKSGTEFVAAFRKVILDDDIVFERIQYPAIPRSVDLPE